MFLHVFGLSMVGDRMKDILCWLCVMNYNYKKLF